MTITNLYTYYIHYEGKIFAYYIMLFILHYIISKYIYIINIYKYNIYNIYNEINCIQYCDQDPVVFQIVYIIP